MENNQAQQCITEVYLHMFISIDCTKQETNNRSGVSSFSTAAMAISAAQKAALDEIINTIVTLKSPRKKRVLSEMFMDLVDRAEWPEYYQVS
jgi:hypothetical protein